MTDFNFWAPIEDELELQFPKGKCKERGNALVLYAIFNIQINDLVKKLKKELTNLNEFENTKKNMIIDKLVGDDLE